MRRPALWSSTVLLAWALAGGPLGAEESPALPADPSLLEGRTENGLRYLLLRHPNPAGRISLWLHVSSGSLNETEEQRGIAHYLEHMAFNGSKNFPPGSVVPFFQSLGMTFGRDQNAFTGFDQTTYQLALPDCGEATVAKGLLYLSDVGLRLSLLPAEIDAERQVILEEKRTSAGAEQRVHDALHERLYADSAYGRRIPIGTEEAIRSFREEHFRAYYSTWYVPSNMTLIAVGDCAMEPLVPAIAKAFADGPKTPRPAPRDPGVRTPSDARAVVVTDPELTAAEVSVLRVEPARPPRATVADFRRELLEELGVRVLNRRLTAALATGRLSGVRARASISDRANAARTVGVEVSGTPENWRAMLRDGVTAWRQAGAHGFTDREVARAAAEALADAEDAVRQRPTMPARRLLQRLNRTVAAGEPILSPSQSRDLAAALLAKVGPEDVARAFRAAFDLRNPVFVASLPAGDGVPTEAELLEAGRAALEAPPPPEPVAEVDGDSLLAGMPEPGKVVAEETHEASGVWSAWFENGVRVHHRVDAQRKNQVTVAVTLAGGPIEETAANRGLTEAGLLAWVRPATDRLTSPQVRGLLAGKNVSVRGQAAFDTVTLTVSGDPRDLESGLQLAHALLRAPVVEVAAYAQWKDRHPQEIRRRKLQPAGLLSEVVAATFLPTVPGRRPLQETDVLHATREAAQEWIRSLAARAPIEVAVVGDVDRARARALLARYLGSLPARPRIGPETFAAVRKVERPKGPLAVERRVPTTTPQGLVLDGFFGADLRDVGDVRRLQTAARIVSTRMIERIREKQQLVYSIRAVSRPGTEHPGFGTFAAQAPTDPSKVSALAAAIEEIYAAFRAEGPTDEEMAVVRRQTANALDEAMRTPEFWVERLQDLDYRGLRLDDVVAMPASYQAQTAAEVRATFAEFCVPEARFRFVLLPEAPKSDGTASD